MARVGGYCTHDMVLHAFRGDDGNSNESNIKASIDDKDINNDISSETNIDDEDEVDIITQKLRRNAENVINPIKEVERMKQENEDEASDNSTGATLYSQIVAEVVDPDFDPGVSVEEEYVATSLKELLSRKGEELNALGPGIATLPLDPTSDEAKSEAKLAKKETELQQVVEEVNASGEAKWNEANLEETSNKQTEVLEKAHKLQTEIDQLFIDDCGAVLLANLAFYEAFSLQDAESMRDVWWQSPSVMCIHPSHPPLIGSTAVFQSFTTMFENDMKAGARVRDGGKKAGAGGVYMTPTNIRGFSVRGSTASLVCDEEIRNRGTAGESSSREGGLLVNKLLTTNIFRKINGQWKMTHRHASWHPTTAASQAAVKAEPGIVLYDEKNTDTNASSNSKSKASLTLKKMNGEGTSNRPNKSSSVPSSLEGLDTNAVLGVPKPKEEEKKKEPKSEEGMIGKIINLSDLLGGGGDSDKDEEDKGIADALSDMLMGSADSGSSSTTGSGTPEDPFITRKIIKIGPEGLDGLIGKNNKSSDDDEEEDKEVVIDLRDKSEEERKEVLSNLVDNVIKDAGISSSSSDLKKSTLDASTISSSEDSSEDIRQRTIATLRKLADDGLLSSKQKRLLMTDIISSTASGTNSIVEVAYELLCTGEDDIGIEDFTEQCHAFADSLDNEYQS